MNTAIKLIGLAFVFSACAALGFYMSHGILLRKKRLERIIACLNELDSRLRYDCTEKERILKTVFGGSEIISFSENCIDIYPHLMKNGDLKPLKEFIDRFGNTDEASEHGRIALCRELTQSSLDAFNKTSPPLIRLYRSLGICIGASICILLL